MSLTQFRNLSAKARLHFAICLPQHQSININKPTDIKVIVQFETEGNGQNEIYSHMDRSEVKL